MPFPIGNRAFGMKQAGMAYAKGNKMGIPKTSIALVLTFGLWLGLALGCSSLRNSAPIKISAEELSKAYESNEKTANDRYKGETLIVTGMVGVTNIPEGVTPPPSFHFGDAPLVVCFAEQKDEVARLKMGQTVTVKGKCMGSVLGFVTVTNCVVQ